MRIKLNLSAYRTPFYLPQNYQPILRRVISQLILDNDREFARQLQDKDFFARKESTYKKPFVFSELITGERQIKANYWQISTC